MFLNPKELKRMMKEAFKASNLVVGNTGEAYYLQGTNWKVLCKKKFYHKNDPCRNYRTGRGNSGRRRVLLCWQRWKSDAGKSYEN